MKRAWKTFLVASAVAAASLASAPIATAAPIISISPSPTNVAPGDSFSLSLLLTDAVNVAAYQVSLTFDPNVLSVTGVTNGTFLDGFDSTVDPFGFVFYLPADFTTTPGTISGIAASLLNTTQGVSGSGLLASIQFTAVNPGTAAVTPFFDAASVDGLFAFDPFFEPITTEFVAGEVTVRGTTPPVPEPMSVLTLALGLGTALARRRRRTRLLTNR